MLRLLGMFGLICTCWGQMGKPTVTKSKDGDPLSGTISMGPPDLSDEETQANYMRSKLRCDACAGIAARFAKALQVRTLLRHLDFVENDIILRYTTQAYSTRIVCCCCKL